MSARNTVAPATIGVTLSEDGIAVEYLDGREVFYHGPPKKAAGAVQTAPGKLVQILVTDPEGTEGVLTYVNDRNTHDDILETTGVGRVFVEPGEEEELFPGVTARADGHSIIVDADPEVARGRVFVFAEDELSEEAYEIVGEDAGGAEGAETEAEGRDAAASDERDADAETVDSDAEAASADGDSEAAPADGDSEAASVADDAEDEPGDDSDADDESGDGWIDSEYVEDE